MMMVTGLLAFAVSYAIVRVDFPVEPQAGQTFAGAAAPTGVQIGPVTSNSGSDSKGSTKTPSSATINQAKVNATQPPEWDRDKVGAEQGRWLAIGLSALIALGFLIYRFSRPKRPEEAEDPTTFTDALQEHSEEILAKCRTPREVRRFLNYLRLVATPTDDRSDESIQGLREKYLDFDTRLVGFEGYN
jgi:hypothetical protein